MNRACLLYPIVLLGCHGTGATAPSDAGRGATPVHAARVEVVTLPELREGPGQTRALEQQRVKAPFTGMLVDLRVSDGDAVRAGQVLGSVVAQESEAALNGARAMMMAARTPGERSDAEHAVALTQRGLVRKALRAPENGVVLSHAADEGALVMMGEEIASIAAKDSLVFIAEVSQQDIGRVKAGQTAHIELTALHRTLPGHVHAVLPNGSAPTSTVPVRIDFDGPAPLTMMGLFGTVSVQVGEVAGAHVVPEGAVLRDDVSGVARLATVGADLRAHWVQVKTGLLVGHRLQVLSPPLPAGQEVLVSGQVGLPEGSPVEIAP